jgi:hypothetical protein
MSTQKGTNEENSIAHELGHAYFDYLTEVKKKPIPSGPLDPDVSSDKWEEILSEAMARRFDTYSRPKGTIIPPMGGHLTLMQQAEKAILQILINI